MKQRTVKQFLLSTIGYSWGILMTLAIPILFIGSDVWSGEFAKLPFMKIHPRYAGGEIRVKIEEEHTTWRIHEPVFDGLINKRKDGFVQIDVSFKNQPIPVKKDIDFNSDGLSDFQLQIDPSLKEPKLKAFRSTIGSITQWAETDDGFIVRVTLTNENLKHFSKQTNET